VIIWRLKNDQKHSMKIPHLHRIFGKKHTFFPTLYNWKLKKSRVMMFLKMKYLQPRLQLCTPQ
jgi:hypothetical protein